MATSEEQLKAWMLMGLDGDKAAHSLLLRALVPLLRSFFRRRLPGADQDVEDLVQDTLIAIHTRRSTFDRDRAFTPWLYAIARYRLIDHVRRRRISVPIEDVEAALVAHNFDDALNAKLDVDALLATLSPKQERAIRDTHLDGKSVGEAATEAGIGKSDVKISVYRGLKAIASRIRGA